MAPAPHRSSSAIRAIAPALALALVLACPGGVALASGGGAARSATARYLALNPGTQPSQHVAPPAFGTSPQIQHLHFRYGPLQIRPGSNMIMLGDGVPKPKVDGYIVGIRPNLTLPDGVVPSVNVIHLHHAVWLNLSRAGTTAGAELFFASGEEKTWAQIPHGFGYPYHASDNWVLNYMIHNLTPVPFSVYITYEIDFVPATAPLAKTMRPVYPVWMDVESGRAYPVFDAHRGSGVNGLFTFPNDAVAPYGSGPPKNEWTLPRAGTLVAVSGHVHPGGLYDTLEVVRPGATVARAARAGQPSPIPGDVPNSVRVFRSQAHYWDPGGPVSWDMAMTKSPANWRVALKAGDVLRVDSTYDVRHQSWYEVMGIMVAYISWDTPGVDPFAHAVQTTGSITHGWLPENANPLGGVPVPRLPNPLTMLGRPATNDTVAISNFTYTPGDTEQELGGGLSDPPTIKQGQSLTFINDDNALDIFHTITSCQLPCTASTGSHYPLANAAAGQAFDSGELGTGPRGFTAASNTIVWKTPRTLAPGTYAYFCRVHPFMRGAFRVVR